MVAALASTDTHGAASVPASSVLEPVSAVVPVSAVGVAASSGELGEPLDDELHPISAAPAPTIEAAANPIKYKEARIMRPSVKAAPYALRAGRRNEK